MKMNKKTGWLLVVLAVLGGLQLGCATIGREFPDMAVNKIEIGKTTRDDIRRMFGSPWRTGVEDGLKTWTYGHYRYRALGESSTRDLVVRFNDKGVVASYVYNTTEAPE